MDNKICKDCNIVKHISEFEWEKNRPNPRNTCKKCRNLNRQYSDNQKQRIKEYKKLYRQSGRATEVWEKHKYGISKSEIGYNHCVICGNTNKLCIDHNHITGKFRALLCSKCNTGIGMFNENINTMTNAIEYLKHFNNNGESFKDTPHYQLNKSEL
jgi:hypothetical protein